MHITINGNNNSVVINESILKGVLNLILGVLSLGLIPLIAYFMSEEDESKIGGDRYRYESLEEEYNSNISFPRQFD